MDIQDDPFASIWLIEKALTQIGYKSQQITINDNLYIRFIAPNGRVWLTKAARISYPTVNASVDYVCRNKNVAYELAEAYGINAPFTLEVTPENRNLDNLGQLVDKYKQLAVKPLDASMSHGLTLDITRLDQLNTALKDAHKYSNVALVQQQVFGEEVRFVVLEGRVITAILRRTPRIIGDGKTSIKDLIKLENQIRKGLRESTKYKANYVQLDENIIDKKYLADTSVLADGEVLELGRGVMLRNGASMYDVLSDVHPSYLETIKRLSNVLGAGFVGIDMVIQDYKQPQNESNYAFMEFNTAPVLNLFYSCRDGKQFDILEQLIPFIDSHIGATTSGQ